MSTETKTNRKTKTTYQTDRYSDQELQEFEQLVDVKINQAKDQIVEFKARLLELGEDERNKIRSLEDGTSSQEMEMVAGLMARQEVVLGQLLNAKTRIKNKTYGICIESGKTIPRERLRAVPHTTKTIEVKNAQDTREYSRYSRR